MTEQAPKPEVAAKAAEELSRIDTSPIESLMRMNADREWLVDLCKRAEEQREGVPQAVADRVVRDYERRIDALETEARPIWEQARGELSRLREIHTRLRGNLDSALLDRQEIEFRHAIGELEKEFFARKHEAAAAEAEQCQKQFDEADAVLARFLELIPEEPEPPTEPAREEESPTIVSAEAPSAPGGSTAVVPVGRLVAAGAEERSFVLDSAATIGRTPDNDIAINARAVSRRHARIEMTSGGYIIRDLGSGNGTFVNDERIEEHGLTHGDHVRFGTEAFLFYSSPS